MGSRCPVTEVLLTGATGMLGSAFAEALQGRARIVERRQLDIGNPVSIDTLVADSGSKVVINCAADVDAERAEGDPDPAYASNAILPGLLATACRRADAVIVHFSSTGCYGDWKGTPYTEEDALRPTTVHHRSKVSGEGTVRESGAEHLILRTGWLYGGSPEHKKNFVWRRLVEAASNSRLASDTSQFGNPTYVGDVVRQTLVLLDQRVRGTFNCVANGTASRYGYVERIVRAGRLSCVLEPAGPFKRLAPVSPNEMAINYRLDLMNLNRMPEWGQSIDLYVDRLRNTAAWHSLNLPQKK